MLTFVCISSIPQTATIKALTYCDVRSLKRKDFEMLAEQFPKVRANMIAVVESRKKELERLSNEFSEKRPNAR